ARPPSTAYRLQKLVQRNKVAFAAAAAVVTVLILGVTGSTWEAIRATRAEHEQRRLRQQSEEAHENEAKLRAHAEAAVHSMANLLARQSQSADLAAASREAVATVKKLAGDESMR